MSRPLSLNGREHWRLKAQQVKAVRETTAWLARAAGIPPLGLVRVDLHYRPRDKRRRDPLNLVATLKPVEDGLVDAGVIPDDTPDHLVPTMPTIDAPGHPPGLYVVVTELA